jgi:glycosyltransferase 2 family protein
LAESRRKVFLFLQLLFGLVVIWFAGGVLTEQWRQVDDPAGLAVQLRWGPIALSASIVLGTYLTLVEAWRIVLRAWGAPLSFLEASRIWFVSNLGRYLPGKVWGLGTMGVLAHAAGISPLRAVASSMWITLITLIAGGAVAAVTGAPVLEAQLAAWGLGAPWAFQLLAIGVAAAVLVASPLLIPRLVLLAERLLRRPLAVPPVRAAVVWQVTAIAVASWFLYGVAFRMFSAGILGTVSGPLLAWVGAYTWSYLLGFVSYVPGGLVVREAALVLALTHLGLSTPDQAALLAVTSRLWLTPLEVLPGLAFLAVRRRHCRD